MPDKPVRHRLFFALWPEEELVKQIHKAVQEPLAVTNGKRVPKHNYHITLVYFGMADADQRACLERAAAKIHGQSFRLSLSQLGYFPKPKVNWLAPTALPDALLGLQTDLAGALVSHCAYQAEQRPYRPHLTLTRKSKRKTEQTEIEPIHWQVNRFVLVQSITHKEGAEYRVIKEWFLD